jgi:hypothetical protein
MANSAAPPAAALADGREAAPGSLLPSATALRDTFRFVRGATGDAIRGMTLEDWDVILPQARRAGLLARLAVELDEQGFLAALPPPVQRHFLSAQVLAKKQLRDIRLEIASVAAAITPGTPVVLLKGAAYVMADLPPARGRLFGDIDIMVPERVLAATERDLVAAGWQHGEIDAYDDRYYRKWMHEVPPLTHISRRTTIDLHHSIIPRTVRLALKAEKLFAAARPVVGAASLGVLSPPDMILHSATHLLNEGEFDRGLRDLDDLHLLLGHFGSAPGFFTELVERAAELDLRRPLFYALRYTASALYRLPARHVRSAGDPNGRPAQSAGRSVARADGCAVRARLASAPRELSRLAQRYGPLPPLCALALPPPAAAHADPAPRSQGLCSPFPR